MVSTFQLTRSTELYLTHRITRMRKPKSEQRRRICLKTRRTRSSAVGTAYPAIDLLNSDSCDSCDSWSKVLLSLERSVYLIGVDRRRSASSADNSFLPIFFLLASSGPSSPIRYLPPQHPLSVNIHDCFTNSVVPPIILHRRPAAPHRPIQHGKVVRLGG